MATSPVKSPDTDSSSHSSGTWVDWNNQLDAYMQWINSQLKKKPGARLVEDLRNDTRDGVAFIDLISVIAGETISGVHDVPSTYAEMKENVERILHFMSAKKIRMHHIMAKDIVDGNLKSIMRLILALAAHYKPNSVKHSSQGSRGSRSSDNRSPNVSSIAQGASAALTAARRHVAKAGNSFRRRGREYQQRRSYYHESSSDQYSDSDTNFHSEHPRVVPGRERGDVDGASAGSSPISGSVYSPQTTLVSSTSSVTMDTGANMVSSSVSKSKSADYITCKDSGTELEDSVFTPGREQMVQKTQYDDLMSEYLKLAEAMSVIKKDLSQLQDLLLSGQPPDGEESSPIDIVEGTTLEQQIVILRSQLQQTKEVNSGLREELSKHKLDLMQIQGVKAGLQQRITDQESTISQLKSELLRRDFQKQNFDSEQANVSRQLHDKDKAISDLRKDIVRRDQKIDQMQHEVQMQIAEKENANKVLRQQLKELNDRFKVVDETGASLKARVASQDKQMARLAGRILHTKNEQIRPPPTGAGAEDLGVLRESLSSLRQCFLNTDPQQHTLDTIEQGISTLMERLSQPSHTASTTTGHVNSYEPQVSRRLNFDGTGDVRRSPITSIPGSKHSSFHPNKLDSPPNQNYTKVLYFMENSTTPSMFTIYKRLGEITLHDFKGSLDRPGQYRYHFKALDPEFGTVKEEISNEDSTIPGWEGKIVAWVEADTGQ